MSDYQLPAPWRCEAELRAGGVMSVTLAGEFDLAAAPELAAAVRRAQAAAARVVVTQPSDCVRRLLALTNTLDHLTIDDGQPARFARSSDRSS